MDTDNEFRNLVGEWLVLYLVAIPISALFIMVFHGALADDFGWQTYGYWTYYQLNALTLVVAGTVFYPISKYIYRLEKSL